MKKPILPGILVPLLLSGCQYAPASTSTPISTSLSPTPEQIAFKQEQQRLTLTLTEDGWLLPGRITSNSQRVSVDWDGDAIELLSKLAHQRGITLRYSGVRLPLPVTIHERDVTFETLLRLIRTQISWRATVTQQSDALEVGFMPPLKGKLS
ncbi:TPA: DotD/TraH family lipoprotein [Salmonella enterica subsp. enterica serovar Glostrup]|nr:DotD/TraH family lipoprotein [Salmonella enterica subsp. enterica serovar Glostrup]